jgi:hypothetical protein
MPIHNRQQELISLALPTDPAGGIDDPPRLVRREIFPPGNIQLFSATSTLDRVPEVEDLCDRTDRGPRNIPVFWRKAGCFT